MNDLLCCSICREDLAIIDLSTITMPIKAEQFKSTMPERGVEAPFLDVENSLDFRCPYCNSFPFHGYEVDKSLTISIFKNGRFEPINLFNMIEARDKPKPIKKYKCSCGATYKHPSSLSRHKKLKGHK